jgi:ABC-2 type transport system ATP-binding protein
MDGVETPTAGATADAARAERPAVIQAERLTRLYGELKAVDALDLTVHEGEVFGLLGPNGAGKTTTILMLLGLSEPSAGFARVLGLDPARNPLEIKRRVGYLPDAVGFYGNMSGRENLRYTARLNGIPRGVGEERIEHWLERVGLSDAADAPVETYSRGMRQRLGLADALVKGPQILILDEPTAAIDPRGVAEVLSLVRELADGGVTVLLSSHLLHQVQQICDRVGIFVGGRMVAVGPMSELAESLAGGPVTVELAVDGGASELQSVAAGVAGVREVSLDPRDRRTLVVSADSDVRAELVRALVAAGHPPLVVRRRGDELDEIYRRYFAAADEAAEAQEVAA